MKKEFKGTKGEWEYSSDNSWECSVVTDNDKQSITLENTDSESDDGYYEMYHNAKLIANAKKLLKVLQGFVSDFEGDYVMDDGRIVDNPSNILINNYEVMKKVLEETLT